MNTTKKASELRVAFWQGAWHPIADMHTDIDAGGMPYFRYEIITPHWGRCNVSGYHTRTATLAELAFESQEPLYDRGLLLKPIRLQKTFSRN